MLYNVPGRTASNLTAETTLRLSKHKNIIGIKEASGNLEQCMKVAKEKTVDFLLISGDDMLTLSIYAIGGVGVISVLANAYPVIFKKIKEYMHTGKLNKAQQEQFKLVEINASMYEEGNPVGLKHLLKTMSIGNGQVRLPLVAASSALQKKIETLAQNI
jgi:4-hydroxy-tetrahydrodipicolinate synthase